MTGSTYVEGYALSVGGLVFAHAWCVDDRARVHDPTWPDGAGLAYLGVPFSATYIRAHEKQFGNACLLHDAHLDGYRVLREGLPLNAIAPAGGLVTENAHQWTLRKQT
jgi:hypothetical protein